MENKKRKPNIDRAPSDDPDTPADWIACDGCAKILYFVAAKTKSVKCPKCRTVTEIQK